LKGTEGQQDDDASAFVGDGIVDRGKEAPALKQRAHPVARDMPGQAP